MKVTFITFILLALVSCGKSNESGKPNIKSRSSQYTLESQEDLRRDFIQTGQDLLKRHFDKMSSLFGARTVSLIRSKLNHENIYVTEQIVMNDRNEITRSYHRNNQLYLYVGEGNLDWIQARNNREKFIRLVLHEIIEFGDQDDRNFRYTDEILRRR